MEVLKMIPMYNTRLFNDIFPTKDSFKDSYDEFQSTAGLTNILDDNDKAITWQLLSARYGNSPIANLSETQFKLKVWQIMFEYGPTWAKRLEIQEKLRGLTDDQLKTGSSIITNIASNPQTSPDTGTTGYISYTDQQTAQNQKKSLLGGYASLVELLETDVCAYYLDRFGSLFKHVFVPDANAIYVTEDE